MATSNKRPLSPREVCVVEMIANGATNREIAAGLGVGYRTVTVYVSRILGHLGLSRCGLIAQYWRERAGQCVTCGSVCRVGDDVDVQPQDHQE